LRDAGYGVYFLTVGSSVYGLQVVIPCVLRLKSYFLN
jgi:hypothetical protein